MVLSCLRRTLIAAGAVAAVAGSAGAQGFNFSTRGAFTSGAATCNNATALLVNVCTDPGSTLSLTFTGRDYSVSDPFGFASGSTVTLGDFSVAGTGSVFDVPDGAVTFTLWIDQMLPTVGSAPTAGFITGTLSRPVGAPSFSSLIWNPLEIVNIHQVTYDLIFRDNGTNGIVISPAGSNTIEAIGTVSVVPEPSTYVLMASGLTALFFLKRRRRSA